MLKLPKDLFLQVVGCAGVGPDAVEGDWRMEPRVAFWVRTVIHRVTEGDGRVGVAEPARVRELWAGGMSLMCAGPVRTGDGVVVSLPRVEREGVFVRATVVRWSPCAVGSGGAGSVVSVDLRFERMVDGPGAAAGGKKKEEPEDEMERIRRAVLG